MRPHYTDFSVSFSSLPPIPAHRRDQLESLLRYTGRGTVSLERLEEDTNGDLVSRPEPYEHDTALHRLQGELLLQAACLAPRADVAPQPVANHQSPAEAAEACFQQALEIARRQQTKALELRAALSLERLWVQQGKREAARTLVVEIYHWFTEGFDTPDLQDTKAFLDTLA